MKKPVFSADFGEYDPRFFGVDLRFNRNTWKTYRDILRYEDKGMLIDYGNRAIKRSVESAFEIFSIASVLAHENRHYHDYFLTPYGNAIIRLRITAFLNGMQAVFLAGKDPVPVPLTRWERMSEEDRRRQVDLWVALDPGRRFKPRPFSGEPLHLLRQTLRTYNQLEDFLFNPDFDLGGEPFNANLIFEASAILAQIQAVFYIFGERQSSLFLNYLLGHPQGQPYLRVFVLLYNLLQTSNSLIDSNLMGAILTWSLLGNFLDNGWDALPTRRLTRLVEYFVKQGIPKDLDRPVLKQFDEWNRIFGYTSTKQTFERNAQANRSLIHSLEKHKSDQSLAGKALVDEVLEPARRLLAANEFMVKRFLEAPEQYTRPYPYIENRDRWVSAPVLVTFTSGGLAATPAEVKQLEISGYIIERARAFPDGSGRTEIIQIISPEKTPGVELIDTTLAINFYYRLCMADFYFFERGREDVVYEIIRQAVNEDEPTAYEIML